MSKVGGGGWAIALAKVLNENGHNVTLWSALEREVEALTKERENKVGLPGVKIPEKIKITNDIKEAVKDSKMIVMAVASSFVRSTSELLKDIVPDGQIIVDVAKGIEDGTFYTMTEVIEDVIPTVNAVVLSGPSHAEEVGLQVPTAVVVGAKTFETASFVQRLFSNDYFRAYTSPDRKSIELGGSLKNVIALAAGIADGLGYGDNTEAALMTRGIKEITQLGVAMGGHSRTFHGLSGIGDLIVTCASIHSRNRRAGILIGQGKTMQEAMDEVKMVVEGVYSAKAAAKLGKKYDVALPIVNKVNEVLFEGKDPREAVDELMLRDSKTEHMTLKW